MPEKTPEQLAAELANQVEFLRSRIEGCKWSEAISAAYCVVYTARLLELGEMRAEQEARFRDEIV